MEKKSMTFAELVKEYLPNSIICGHCGLSHLKEAMRYCNTCKEYYCSDCSARHYRHKTYAVRGEG